VEVECYDLRGGHKDLVCYELGSLIDKGGDTVVCLDNQPLGLYDNIIEDYFEYASSEKSIVELKGVDLGDFGSNRDVTSYKVWTFENGFKVSLLLPQDSNIEYLVMGFKK
jgi:hypothetical protein